MFYTIFKSPVGVLHLLATDTHLTALIFDKNWKAYSKNFDIKNKKNEILNQTIAQLKEYFSGHRQDFTIPVDFTGTDLQIKTWKALQTIPYGQTISYSDQAAKLKKPKAVRFIGTTNGKNPISIIVPCHRVIGKNGSLTGYGGGLSIDRKSVV